MNFSDLSIGHLADETEKLIEKLSLVIEIAHYILVISGVRGDWDIKKARKHPVGTWLTSLACCFGGGMLINIAVGKPAFLPLANTQSVALMSTVWWLIFYSPMDVFFKFLSWKPILITIVILKEMIRTKKITKGVMAGHKSAHFSDSILVCTVLGMMGACGGGFVKNAATFIRKQWTADSVKEVYFSPTTKLALLFSHLYTLVVTGILDVEYNKIILAQVIVMSCFSILAKLGENINPFSPLEKFITSCAVDYSLFGEDSEQEAKPKTEPTRKGNKKETHKKKD